MICPTCKEAELIFSPSMWFCGGQAPCLICPAEKRLIWRGAERFQFLEIQAPPLKPVEHERMWAVWAWMPPGKYETYAGLRL